MEVMEHAAGGGDSGEQLRVAVAVAAAVAAAAAATGLGVVGSWERRRWGTNVVGSGAGKRGVAFQAKY
jgi:hypothetical protein